MKQLSLVILWVIGISLFAQNVKRFRHLTINDGLAHTDAICFEQDDKGFIWIGTNSGLNKYDGRQVRSFKNNIHQTRKVYSNRIWSLCYNQNYLWIGTERGLQLFDLQKEKYKVYTVQGPAANLAQATVTNIVSVKNAMLVQSTGGMFLCEYNHAENRLIINNVEEKISDYPEWFDFTNVKSIATDSESRLWIGCNKGILACSYINGDIVLDKGYIENSSIGLDFGNLWDIKYWDNRLWVSKGQKLQIFSLNTKINHIRNSLKVLNIKDLFEDKDNLDPSISISKLIIDEYENLWGATKNGLILIEDPFSENIKAKLIEHSDVDPLSLSANHLTNVFIDKTNCLWVGSWGGGASILDLEQKKFNLLMHNNKLNDASLSSPFVRAISEDKKGLIWIGLKDQGIDIFNPKTGKVIPLNKLSPKASFLSSDNVRSILPLDGLMYIGTANGLNEVDINTYSIKKYSTKLNGGHLPNYAIYALETDSYNQLWCGTWGGGLTIIKNVSGKTEYIHLDRKSEFSLSSNTITNLFYDKARNVMFAASNKGLNEIVLDEYGKIIDIHYYREHEGSGSLTGEYLWPILKENDSVMWIGSLGGGLNRMVLQKGEVNGKLAPYVAKSYYPGGRQNVWDVETLLEDDKGNLWLGGRGLSKFNKKTGEFWQFDVNDGLQSNGFKIGSAYKAKDGTLYFGGINGLNFFKPAQIKANAFTPRAALTQFTVQNKEIKADQKLNNKAILTKSLTYTKEIKLNYLENDFSIYFSAMHYANPAKCQFKYKLEGADVDWVLVKGDYPVANYSNLKYGDYVFKVLASNPDGKFSDEPAVLRIHIDAPWWLSFWSILVYVLIFILILFLFYSYQSKMLTMRNNLKLVEAEEAKNEELHQMKLQFFTNISHEFKTPLTLILSPIEKLLDEKLTSIEQSELLKMINKNAKRLLNLVNELMDFRKAEVGKVKLRIKESNIGEIVQSVLEHYTSYTNSKGIQIKYSSQVSNVYVDTESLVKIINNLISNALKFTHENGSIEVEVFNANINRIKPVFKNEYRLMNELKVNDFTILKVKDSGIGIAKDSLSQVFERFYHVNEQAQQHLCTGIGLALVKSLVGLHHGSLIISSELNVGTEILVAFPAGNKHINIADVIDENDGENLVKDLLIEEFDTHEHIIEDAGLNDALEQRILIVEDNVELRSLLIEHYKKNFTILEAENGKVGVELALKDIPDIIISDIMMPEMDGIELCKILKQDLNTSHIPILLLTAKSSMENQIEGAESGADAYIPKPFSMRLLDAKVEGLLNHFKTIKEKYASDVFASTREIVKNKKDHDFIDNLIELIDKNMDNNEFSVEQLCKEVGIGRTNLYKKIKSLTGQSLGEFIRMLRLKKAAKILVSEDVSITEVIYRVGINSNSYFTKAFKTQFGVTPTEFVANSGMFMEIDNEN